VNNVYQTPEALRAGVAETAATIAAKSPLSIRGIKEMILYSRDHSVADGLNYVPHGTPGDADIGRSRRGDDRGEREAGAKIPGLARVRGAQPTTASTVGNFALLCSTLTRLSTSLACRGTL